MCKILLDAGHSQQNVQTRSHQIILSTFGENDNNCEQILKDNNSMFRQSTVCRKCLQHCFVASTVLRTPGVHSTLHSFNEKWIWRHAKLDTSGRYGQDTNAMQQNCTPTSEWLAGRLSMDSAKLSPNEDPCLSWKFWLKTWVILATSRCSKPLKESPKTALASTPCPLHLPKVSPDLNARPHQWDAATQKQTRAMWYRTQCGHQKRF